MPALKAIGQLATKAMISVTMPETNAVEAKTPSEFMPVAPKIEALTGKI